MEDIAESKTIDKDYRKSIIKYYDNTRLDYWILWYNKDNLSVHFGYYDDNTKNHGDALMNLNKVMAKEAGIKDGDIVLDAGCGQGGSSMWLANNFNVNVTGISLVPHQIKKATKIARKQKLDNRVLFFEQDYSNTTFEDESFSVIWACESVCHAMDKADFFNEAYRLLKPGGRLICADYIRSNRTMPDKDEKLLHSWLDGWSIKDIDTYDEYKNNAIKCGFVDFELKDITKNTKPSLRHLYSMSSKLLKIGKGLKMFGLRNDINHGNQVGSIRQYEALENNLWYYGILSLRKKG
jgi:cyclopropane fatty-acyl-phospholipid synthase-like methyltransferase